MNTLTPLPPVEREPRIQYPTARKNTAITAGLLGLLPGAGLVLAPMAMRWGVRDLQQPHEQPAAPRSKLAVAAIILGVVGLLVQVAVIGVLFWLAAGAGGSDDPPKTTPTDTKPPPKPAEVKKVEVGKNVTLEVMGEQRRVVVNATVCLREGQLELLLTRKELKEHEALLAADVDARHIHTALLLAGAKEGTPVKFAPKYQPATGSSIKVTLQYEEKGKLITRPAQDWIRHEKTGKNLNIDWVFGGSRLVDVPLEPGKKYYLANDGDLICISNFETAMLDLPINSPKDNAELAFTPHTDRIPPLKTKVTVILEVVPEKK